jgi:hypothetical protein
VCACYPNITATAPKLAPCSTRCVFLGYSPDHKGSHCYDLASHRVLISRHVVFDESDFSFSTSSVPSLDPEMEPMFSNLVVQPPISVFPFPVGSPGAPTPLPVSSVASRAALVHSLALSVAPEPSVRPRAASTPSPASSAAPTPSLGPRAVLAPPPVPRATLQVPADYPPCAMSTSAARLLRLHHHLH